VQSPSRAFETSRISLKLAEAALHTHPTVFNAIIVIIFDKNVIDL
jgi:hypothetical protein